jgi:N-glycosylase/DNA lyase
LTANFNAEKGIIIQGSMSEDFLNLPESKHAKKLREYGHRHPNIRAKYIVKARKHIYTLKKVVSHSRDEKKVREWFVKNIKGLGYKEASHFLRNIGFKNFAILDFHIIDVLVRYRIIEKPKTLTKKKYLEIEELLRKVADKLNLNLAELDLYLWYMDTGKVLK